MIARASYQHSTHNAVYAATSGYTHLVEIVSADLNTWEVKGGRSNFRVILGYLVTLETVSKVVGWEVGRAQSVKCLLT